MSFNDLIRGQLGDARRRAGTGRAVPTDPEPVSAAETATEPSLVEPGPPFDPAEYTVAQVLEYVEANPDDADAVRDAEAAGRARSGILTALGG